MLTTELVRVSSGSPWACGSVAVLEPQKPEQALQGEVGKEIGCTSRENCCDLGAESDLR